ncbi:MAG: dienelactone hydrolase family protein [bacterium]
MRRDNQAESQGGKEVTIPVDTVSLKGTLAVPERAGGVVVFAHGSGSSRLSPRNNYVASVLRQEGIGTLLFDLLTESEDEAYERRFDIELLTQRLVASTRWLQARPEIQGMRIGYFGASTGAAAALRAAAILGSSAVSAVVSRGGRPDMASPVLSQVSVPTLLIVGGKDQPVILLNRQAYTELKGEKELVIVPGASHLFEEPGKLEEVARLATRWFKHYLDGTVAE